LGRAVPKIGSGRRECIISQHPDAKKTTLASNCPQGSRSMPKPIVRQLGGLILRLDPRGIDISSEILKPILKIASHPAHRLQ